MLRLTVELVPGGYAPATRTIASMRIANVSDLADVSDYVVEAMEGANRLTGDPARHMTCEVIGHDRRQSVWKLVERACAEIANAESVEL